MHPSLWTGFFFRSYQPEESLRAIKQAGFCHCELAHEHLQDIAANKRLAGFKRTARTIGIVMRQCHAPFSASIDLADARQAVRERGLKIMSQSLDYCAELEIPLVIMHPGGVKGWKSKSEYTKIKALNYDAFSRLAEQAARHHITIALENMGETKTKRMYCSHGHELLDFIRSIDSPFLKICLDTSHANLIRNFNIAGFIEAAQDQLAATHISDNLGTNDDHLLPYAGTIDWQPIINSLRKIKYKGLLNLEIPGENGERNQGGCPRRILNLKARYCFNLLTAMIRSTPIESLKSR